MCDKGCYHLYLKNSFYKTKSVAIQMMKTDK